MKHETWIQFCNLSDIYQTNVWFRERKKSASSFLVSNIFLSLYNNIMVSVFFYEMLVLTL